MRTHKILWIFLTLLLLLPILAQAEGGQISGKVWLESTIDGKMAANESLVSGAVITLEQQLSDGSFAALDSAMTGNDGAYNFRVAAAGAYRLSVQLPTEYRFTMPEADSAALPAQGSQSRTNVYALADGQSLTLNFGATKHNGGFNLIAFVDENANGGRLTSEPLLRGVVINVYYDNYGKKLLIATGTTDKDGECNITSLTPATYTLEAVLPENYALSAIGKKINSFYNCFYPNDDGTGYTEPLTLEPKTSMAVGVGVVKAGAVTGRVWLDENGNGKMDADEGGLMSAIITLTSSSDSRTATTDADGVYSFLMLQPGSYTLSVQLPENMVFTGGSSLLTAMSSADQTKITVKETTLALSDIGATASASLTLNLYQDQNQNGVWDDDELPMANAQVTIRQNGQDVLQVKSDANGFVDLSVLRAGTMEIHCTLPSGYVFADGSKNFFTTPGANTAGVQVTLPAGAIGSYSSGAVQCAAISGTVYECADHLGEINSRSKGISGLTVQAINLEGQVKQTALTDQKGHYTLQNLMPGFYRIRVMMDNIHVSCLASDTQEEPYNHLTNQNPEYADTDVLLVDPGTKLENIDAALFQAGTVEGYVYLEIPAEELTAMQAAYVEAQTAQGVKPEEMPAFVPPYEGVSGVVALLTDLNGVPASSYTYATTDEDGHFMIKGVQPGEWQVVYTLPDNSIFAGEYFGMKQLTSAPFTLATGKNVCVEKQFTIATASLRGQVYLEEDGRRVPASATLNLFARNQGVMFTVETDAEGRYAFMDLMEDDYELTVIIPDYLVFGQAEHSPILPGISSIATTTMSLTAGQKWNDADICVAYPASMQGFVFKDRDQSLTLNGDEYGLEDQPVALYMGDVLIADALTNENGIFQIETLVPGHYNLRLPLAENEVALTGEPGLDNEWRIELDVKLGENLLYTFPVMSFTVIHGEVWSLDYTYHGVAGHTITLLNEEGQEIATTVTDKTGAFQFNGLYGGTYSVCMDIPEGYFLPRDVDLLYRDSVMRDDKNGGYTLIPITVITGDEVSGFDIGIGTMGTIGDHAWLDENGNGMQDIGESAMPGIEIELYQLGELIASTVTDTLGNYKIENLYPGPYQMKVTYHAELKPTLHQTEFPLVASIMPECEDTTVWVQTVIAPSGYANLHCDLGFVLREEGVYPEAIKDIPEKNWRPYSQRKR